jgi:hypothetical protein
MLSILLYAAGYSLVFFADRYLWPLWGLMAAMSVAAPWIAYQRVLQSRGAGSEDSVTRLKQSFFVVPLVLILTLLINLGITLATQAMGNTTRLANELRRSASQLSNRRTFVSPDCLTGVSFAYWSQGSFAGLTTQTTPQTLATELKEIGAVTLVLVNQSRLADLLEASPLFQRVELASHSFAAFEPKTGK